MKIMAIDYGQHTGIAIGYSLASWAGRDERPSCLTIDCGEQGQFARFQSVVGNLIALNRPDKIVYASVYHPSGAGAKAAHMWGGYWAVSCLLADTFRMPEPEAYSEMSAKKYFTGSGKASKQEVISACIRHGYGDILPTVGTRKKRISEDAADALMLLCYAGRMLG